MKIGNWYVRRNQTKRQNSVVRRGWFSISMFFNNLCGKNFSGEKYRDYIRYIAFGEWVSSLEKSHSTVTEYR